MSKRQILLFIVVLLISACAQPATVATPTEPPTDTPIPETPTETPTSRPPTVTPTPLPPTQTLTPQPTATATNASTPTPDIPKELVEIPYEDRVIRGTLLGDGDIAVILAPMWGEERSSWIKFAKLIAPLGYTALAIDFPGVGTSSGEFSFTKVNFDVVAVIDFLQARGYESVVCMGASLGAGACYEAAVLRPNMAGLVIIAAPVETTAEVAATLLMPKLFMVGNEPEVKSSMDKDYQMLPMPKQFKTLTEKAHGTNLQNTDTRDEFNNILVDFLDGLRSATLEPTVVPSPTSTLPPNWLRKAQMPTARWGHSSSVVGGKIYVFGGVGGSEKVEAYDPLTDTWTTKADLPTPRNFLTTSVIDGKIYAIGGNQGFLMGEPLHTLEVYDPETDTWESRTDTPTARTALSSASVNGKIYTFGGCILRECEIVSTVEEYDPITDTWTLKTDMPTPRELPTTGVVDGKIYVIGGLLARFGSAGALVEVYDPETDTWEKKADMPEIRAAPASVINEMIYIFGGTPVAGGTARSNIFEYNTVTDTWKILDDMPFRRVVMTTNAVNGKVYLVGGSATSSPHKPYLAEVLEYSPEH